MTYFVNKTNINKPIIEVQETSIDTNQDISLFGRRKLQYGQAMNENLLHLLENFSCLEDTLNPGNPDTSQTSEIVNGISLLTNPSKGQLWYEPVTRTLYMYKGPSSNKWLQISMFGDNGANWGVISDGARIPQPVSSTGYVFPYSECSWMVSPFNFNDNIDFMECSTDTGANVTINYSLTSSPTLISGNANYMIVGIKGNINLGNNSPVPTP